MLHDAIIVGGSYSGMAAALIKHYAIDFAVLTPGGATDGGTDVTESFRLNDSALMKLFAVFGGQLRRRRNIRDMRKTLERIKAVVEAPEAAL